MRTVRVGSIVTLMRDGGRANNNEPIEVPAVVMRQWEDGDLMLYVLHFEGAHLAYKMRLQDCTVVVDAKDSLEALAPVEVRKQLDEESRIDMPETVARSGQRISVPVNVKKT